MRLFEEQDRLRALKLEQLRRDIEDGLNSGEPSKWAPQEVKRLGRARRTENQLTLTVDYQLPITDYPLPMTNDQRNTLSPSRVFGFGA